MWVEEVKLSYIQYHTKVEDVLTMITNKCHLPQSWLTNEWTVMFLKCVIPGFEPRSTCQWANTALNRVNNKVDNAIRAHIKDNKECIFMSNDGWECECECE